MDYHPNSVDELFERYIAAIIHAKTWQSLVAEHGPAGIPGPMFDKLQSQHRLQFDPFLNEYKKQRQLGSDAEQALQIVLAKMGTAILP